MSEHSEGIKSEEVLVEEAKKLIYRNLSVSGLATDIIEKSGHAEKPFSPWTYPRVDFAFSLGSGTSIGGVDAWPELTHVHKGVQPVVLKLDRLFRREMTKMKEAAAKIWDGVSDEHKRAIASQAIRYQTKRWNAEVDGGRARAKTEADAEEKERILFYLGEAEDTLERLKPLQKALSEETATISVEYSGAILQVVPPKKEE